MLFYFKNKIDPEISNLCRFCLEECETFWHLITECPVYWKERMELCGETDILNGGRWTVDMLMDFASNIKIAKALEGYDEIWYEDIETDQSEQNEPEPEPD